MLVVSFALLGFLWRQPLLAPHADGTAGSGRAQRVPALDAGCACPSQTVSVLLLVPCASSRRCIGDEDPFMNLAPTWIYVVFWLGLPLLSVLFGDVWRALSPWRAIADGTRVARRQLGREARPCRGVPRALGRWPAAVALFAFVALELAYTGPSRP